MNNIELFEVDEYTGDDNAEFYTPKSIVDVFGEFDLDPCGARYQPNHELASTTYNLARGQNGLQLPWFGRVWLNPPYGNGIEEWMRMAVDHGNVLALVPGRTSSSWFQDNVFGKADAVLFMRKRLRFMRARPGASYRASFASVFVAYGFDNARSLHAAEKRGHIEGVYFGLRAV